MEQLRHTENGLTATRGPGWFFALRESAIPYFSATDFPDYAAFLRVPGEVLKADRKSRVVLLRQHGATEETDARRSYALKQYRYPLPCRIRTWFRISKAEREFHNLIKLRRLGAPAAEPVAFGAERSRFGFVRSCFLITTFVEDAVDFKAWSRRENQRRAAVRPDDILRQLGETFRRLHQMNFFIFTAKPKNILVRRSSGQPHRLLFIDVPYAASVRWPLARWAQARDLGMLLANLSPGASDGESDPFYDAYLPDPFGGSAPELKQRVMLAIRRRQNRTPISALVRRLKRVWRRHGVKWGQVLGASLDDFGSIIDDLAPNLQGLASAVIPYLR